MNIKNCKIYSVWRHFGHLSRRKNKMIIRLLNRMVLKYLWSSSVPEDPVSASSCRVVRYSTLILTNPLVVEIFSVRHSGRDRKGNFLCNRNKWTISLIRWETWPSFVIKRKVSDKRYVFRNFLIKSCFDSYREMFYTC